MSKLQSIKNNKSQNSKKLIDPDRNVNELLAEYPEIAPILTYEYGLFCVNCYIAEFDTLRNGADIHGINEDDLKEMIEHLEKIVNGESESTHK